MKISKFLPALCAFVVSANCLTIRAEDNAAQAAARLALAKQLFETGAQQPGATNAAPPATLTPFNPKEAKAKAKQEAADLKAKNEADKKMAMQQADIQARTDADKKSEAEKAALAAALADKQANNAMQTTTNTSAAKPMAKAKKEKKPKTVSAAQPAAGSQSANASGENYAGKDLGMQPLTAPALPINASKEARLQALLAKYKADQISPEDYHKQRSAILTEP